MVFSFKEKSQSSDRILLTRVTKNRCIRKYIVFYDLEFEKTHNLSRCRRDKHFEKTTCTLLPEYGIKYGTWRDDCTARGCETE